MEVPAWFIPIARHELRNTIITLIGEHRVMIFISSVRNSILINGIGEVSDVASAKNAILDAVHYLVRLQYIS